MSSVTLNIFADIDLNELQLSEILDELSERIYGAKLKKSEIDDLNEWCNDYLKDKKMLKGTLMDDMKQELWDEHKDNISFTDMKQLFESFKK